MNAVTRISWSVVKLAVCFALLLAAYVGSYFALVERDAAMVLIPSPPGTTQPMYELTNHYRFGGRFARVIFWPLAEIDSALRGEGGIFIPD